MRAALARIAFVLVSLLLFSTFALSQTTWYVDDSNNVGPWDGSQANPFQHIQDGIDTATDGDSVLVMAGTYVETIDFHGKAVTVKSSDGPDLTVIDGNKADHTVSFADKEGQDSVLDGFKIINGKGLYHAGVYCSRSGPVIRNNIITLNIRGIVCLASSAAITNNAIRYNTTEHEGAGIFSSGSTLTIMENTIEKNTAHWGGGVYCKSYSSLTLQGNFISENIADSGAGIFCCDHSSATITENTFSGNTVEKGGGGIYCDDYAVLSIQNNIFSENSATGLAGYGGAIHINISHSSATILENTIIDNFAKRGGGGIYCINSSVTIENNYIHGNKGRNAGGGIYCTHMSPAIRNNTITENISAWNGGGIFGYHCSSEIQGNIISGNRATNENGAGICMEYSSPTITSNVISGNTAGTAGGGLFFLEESPILENCEIYENLAGEGGGICCGEGSLSIIRNCTIINNSAFRGGGVFCDANADPTITNSTIHANEASVQGGGIFFQNSSSRVTNTIIWENNAPEGPEIYKNSGSSPIVTFCDVLGGWTGMGNIDANPLFVDALNGDLHLRLGSPCCDSGDNSAPDIPAIDYEGDGRIVDGNWPLDGNAIVDMGADEILCEVAVRFGNVNAVGDSLGNVLLVNGSPGDNKRVFSSSTGEAITMTMEAPSAGPSPAHFALYAILYEPDLGDIVTQPKKIGISCMPMPLSNGNCSPPPLVLCNTIGFKKTLGFPLLRNISPAPCTIFDVPIIPTGIYTFQGVIFDNGSAGRGVSLTNAIVLKVL